MGNSYMKQSCYVIMPFRVRPENLATYDNNDDHWKDVYVGLIQPAIKKAGLSCSRDDEDGSTRLIARNIMRKIEKSDLVLCDLSSNNPNVLFELGWALRANKHVILIKDEVTPSSFDIQGVYTFSYSHRLPLHQLSQLTERLTKNIKEAAKTTTAQNLIENATLLEEWGMTINNKPILIKQRCSVDIFHYKIGFTKKDAEKIAEKLRTHGIVTRKLEHNDPNGPDAIFIGAMVDIEDARLVMSLVPHNVNFLFRPDYPEVEGGDSEGDKIGIGYSSRYNAKDRDEKEPMDRKRMEPVHISAQQLAKLLDEENDNATFHRLLWKHSLSETSNFDE